jgi:DNA-binding NtrC family response regulator
MAETDGASFHGIIGRSPPMLALFWQIERAAAFDFSVLIRARRGPARTSSRARSGREAAADPRPSPQ